MATAEKPLTIGQLARRANVSTSLLRYYEREQLLEPAGRSESGYRLYAADDEPTVAVIKELLDERVRPAVANDGGDITFKGFKDGIVFLSMRGACAGCPSSTATLRMGIENLMRHFVPEVQEVRAVEE